MTSTTADNGRLGNQIIRNLSVSLVAKKHNLKVDYSNKELIEKLGIELFSGTNSYSITKDLTDDNYFIVYDSNNVNYNLNPNSNYFQTKKITNLLYNYLHSPNIKSKIMDNNEFKERYAKNNDLFIHIRLTDVEKFNPGIKYYIKAIKNINFDKLYISTDDPNNNMIIKLKKLYPYLELVIVDEITTFKFASTCAHIILSHGSFSTVIGYLSFFSNVYYPEYESHKIWYGDTFSINNWIKLNIN